MTFMTTHESQRMIFLLLNRQQQTDKECHHFILLTTLQHWPTVYNSNITKDLHPYNTALLSEQGRMLENNSENDTNKGR